MNQLVVLTLFAFGAVAHAQTRVTSESNCPSATAVSEALAKVTHVHAPFLHLAQIYDDGPRFRVVAGTESRDFEDAARDCNERAKTAAVYIAVTLEPPAVPAPPASPPPPPPTPSVTPPPRTYAFDMVPHQFAAPVDEFKYHWPGRFMIGVQPIGFQYAFNRESAATGLHFGGEIAGRLGGSGGLGVWLGAGAGYTRGMTACAPSDYLPADAPLCANNIDVSVFTLLTVDTRHSWIMPMIRLGIGGNIARQTLSEQLDIDAGPFAVTRTNGGIGAIVGIGGYHFFGKHFALGVEVTGYFGFASTPNNYTTSTRSDFDGHIQVSLGSRIAF